MKRTWKAAIIIPLLAGGGLVFALPSGAIAPHPARFSALLWVLPALLLAAWVQRRRAAAPVGKDMVAACILYGALVITLLYDSTTHPLFYFLNWNSPGGNHLWGSGLGRTVLLTTLITPLFLWRGKRRLPAVLLGILLLSQGLGLFHLLHETQGAALYQDDHPAFLYRLWAFGKIIPRFVYYDPFWNGGLLSNHLVASGTLAPGLFLWPLWKFLPVTATYTPALGVLFIVVTPLLAFGSLRLCGLKNTPALCGAIFATGVSRYYFHYLLHFGTVGSIFATVFVLPLAAGLFRVWRLGRFGVGTMVLIVLSAFFFFLWPPNIITAAPFMLTFMIHIPKLTKPKLRALTVCALAITVLCLPLAAALWSHSDLSSYVSQGTGSLNLSGGWELLRKRFVEAHPLLLFFGVGGIFPLLRKPLGRWCAFPVIGLLLLAGWGEQVKPLLQLERMAIPALFLAVIPAGYWLGRIMRVKNARLAPIQASLVALLSVGGLNAAQLYRSEVRAEHSTLAQSGELRELIDWVRQNTPPEGRVLLAGSTVHGYGGGHVAFLPVLTGREMLAGDYYHFSPRLVEYNYPHREFRKHGQDKLFRFMQLYNVTHIITYQKEWKAALRKYDDRYEELVSFGKKTVFRTRRDSEMFLSGEGRVEAGLNRLTVRVEPGVDEVVLKYNWTAGLSIEPEVDFYPYDTGTTVRLIAFKPAGNTRFEIGYRKWL